MERWGLHRRLALGIVSVAGTRPSSLVLGFMAATAFISMWVSNTATTAMMVPIGVAVAQLLRPPEEGAPFPFGVALMLGIAYAATIGGFGTLIGTPPNAIFAGAARELLGRSIGFGEWMLIGVPVTLVFLPIAWALLVFVFHRPGPLPEGAGAMLDDERRRLGPMSAGERVTLIVFIAMAVAWIMREPKVFDTMTVPGLATWLPGIDDSTIAIAGAIALFLIPVDARAGRYTMEWSEMRRLPWGVLLLFGGGLSLARAFETSGLSALIGQGVASLGGLPFLLILGITAATFIFLSDIASNTAVAAMAMPLLAAAAQGMGIDPVTLMATGALAASGSFLLPVSTPPNAIAFGTGYIEMKQMVRVGFVLDLLSILLMTLVGTLLIGPLLGP
jgi:sodium-dependent dicarboxylate transporter 2/3/5